MIRCASISLRTTVPKIAPGILPIISGRIFLRSRLERRFIAILRFMVTPQSVQTATAVLISRIMASRGIAISAEPNPVNPCRKPALRKISGTSINGVMGIVWIAELSAVLLYNRVCQNVEDYFLRRIKSFFVSSKEISFRTSAPLTADILSIRARWSVNISTGTVMPDSRSWRRELVSIKPVQQSAQQMMEFLFIILGGKKRRPDSVKNPAVSTIFCFSWLLVVSYQEGHQNQLCRQKSCFEQTAVCEERIF